MKFQRGRREGKGGGEGLGGGGVGPKVKAYRKNLGFRISGLALDPKSLQALTLEP